MLDKIDISYNIYGSGELATQPLPQNALVWIVNDQSQTFYNIYADNQERFNQFVEDGGMLVFGACDSGFGGGSIDGAGIELPGGVSSLLDYDNNNYNVNPNHPLMYSVPTEIYGTNASHNYLANLPNNAVILAENSQDEPTFVEYSYGNGIVIATGQTLEYAWANNQDSKQIYANIFYYAFNLQFEAVSLDMQNLQTDSKSSKH